VLGHQVPQGPFVGQAEAVREHDGRVHHHAVDELREKTVTGKGFRFQPRNIVSTNNSLSLMSRSPQETQRRGLP